MSSKPNQRCKETAGLKFWRALDAELHAVDEPSPPFVATATLFYAGYSLPQAFRVLAPGKRPALRSVSNF